MADDEDLSPLPFRRERNLSNRNFNKRSSRHRISSSGSVVELERPSSMTNAESASRRNSNASSSSSSFQLSYSVNSDSEQAFNQRSTLKLRTMGDEQAEQAPALQRGTPITPTGADPALLDVRQKVQRFETLKSNICILRQERHSLKLLENRRHPSFSHLDANAPIRTPPTPRRIRLPGMSSGSSSIHSNNHSIDEVRSEDEVDQISDFETDAAPIPEHIISESSSAVLIASSESAEEMKLEQQQQQMQRSISADQSGTLPMRRKDKDFARNYQSKPRRKTEIVGTTNQQLIEKFHSFYQPNDDDDEIELRDKSDKFVQPVLEELIRTEEAYVNTLFTGLEDYGNLFQHKDLPVGLRGKKYDLFGNIEQIAEFHRDEFLPMLHRNRRDLKRLFDEFIEFLHQNCFYGYVIFTMNKQKSLKLCDQYKNFFTRISKECGDKLGINSFLTQPIQRMMRYPLLLNEFIQKFFKNRNSEMKPLLDSCCRLEKRVRNLLDTTNESETINDIVDCHEFNVYYQGKFRKVSEFQVNDHKLKRSYRAKAFIFDKCIIYTEIKGKQLIFHGRYPCEHVGISARTRSFTLYYQRRKQQECEFTADAAQIEVWLDLIRDMINNYANEERQKLQERYSRENDHLHRKAPSFSLYRDSNRFSSDSGIGNMWTMPKPDEDTASNRTTWYAAT
ncbi:kalirin [Drosophila busckii]|uniref:kalirin n=1 Tax=Drosophila busckii TaxID=30019 RepID=UPI00083E9B79|nr:kalirin [Drosophila busckii]